MRKAFGILLGMLLLTSAGSTFAGKGAVVIATGSGSETQTKAYAGLAWTLGAKKSAVIPDLVVGVRSLKAKSNDRVSNGADLSARFTFLDGFSFDSVRLSYVGGKRDVLGNVGVGYSFANKGFLGTIAAQGAHARAGLDYDFSASKTRPYLELLSLGKPDKAGRALRCSSDDPIWTVPPGANVGDLCFFND